MAKLWDRLPGENNLWWDRFDRYRLMGPSRSVLACYNDERATQGLTQAKYAPSSWRGAEVRYKWRERAEAWDESGRTQNNIEHADDRAKAKAQRQELVDVLRDLALTLAQQNQALIEKDKPLNPYQVAQVAIVLRAALAESRLEFGEPTEIRGVTGADGGPIQTQELSKLGVTDEQKKAIIRQAAARLELIK